MSSSAPEPNAPPAVDRDLARRLAAAPDAWFEVVITARGDLAQLEAALPPEARVTHAYRLIRSLAVRGTGAALTALAAHPAVGAIEPVRDVNAWTP